jgi:hypothetical protein
MEPWVWGVILKPFGALIIFGGIALPIRWLINKKLPEGRLKHELLKHRWGKRDSLCR